jgi:transcriptional regulator with XRE-family HTH domain
MVNSPFAEKLAGLLEMRGWSYRQLAMRSGVSAAYINLLASGKRETPSLDVAIAIAKAFGVSLNWLADLPDRDQPADAVTPDEQELLALYRELHPDARRMFLEVTRSQVRFANRITRKEPPTPNSEPNTDKT